ncbi:DNA polymerase III subunit gamma/tau [Lachnobacterium bovis]|uniref:DNA-directed DNA polymerase n=1 Tax=Lachnobacterium bovis TaxID=140626 RepID=A0A1H9UQS8_9FIRM|nr:DNA polymerase III subunit gamma/tau [Lachnobacterium bovis]SES11890.1 DNA polymerase-3 subunit gamma/tau [Lachnobacterium bovis]
MSYTALYRKFRPQEFEDVKGQDHIVTTLKNQIKANRIGHAYLFCGTRGTGKTTVAKIFARAVNCENSVDGSPCGECPSCKAIADGSSMNVIEIDAASNNGVENIRQIKEEVAYRPTEGKYKVYIIDEVHMLSNGAFNALLKTLEEPPSYVIFILATTEAHMIPLTILSRCQRYDFKRISIETISERLNELMAIENVECEEKAIRYIAKSADGALRDALSLLDQCIAFHLGKKLTYDMVLEVLGAVDTDVFTKLFNQIVEKNLLGAISTLEELVIKGRELGQFVNDFTWYLRNLLLLKSSDGMEDVLDVTSENLEILKKEIQKISIDELMRYIRIFSELSNKLKHATQKRIIVEIGIIKLCKPEMEQNYDSIVNRIIALEKKIEKGVVVASANSGDNNNSVQLANETKKMIPKELPKALPKELEVLAREWNATISACGGVSRNYFREAVPTVGSNNEIILVLDNKNAYEYLSNNRGDCITDLKNQIANKIGKSVEVIVQQNKENVAAQEAVVDFTKLINMEIEEEQM